MEEIAQSNQWWVCLCGNEADADGFVPCDTDGNEVWPTPEAWVTGWYVCFRCGRVIAQDSLRVVKRVDPATIRWLADHRAA
jgi:hypothetical protein